MSRLQELLDTVKTRASQSWQTIQETESYQNLSERYLSQTPQVQKIIKVLAVFTVAFVILFYPLSSILQSKTLIAQFESQRELVRDLFKTYRNNSTTQSLPPSPSTDTLIGMVNSFLEGSQLLPEQILSVSASTSEGRLIPEKLLSGVVEVKLSKLNLDQIIDIGTRLVNISKSVKMKDMMMNENTELKGYFEVTYKLYALNVPEAPPPVAPDIELPKKTKKKSKETTDGDE